MTSLVFLIASKPAALENSNTSPLGTCLAWMVFIVSCFDTVSTALAIAFRKLLFFCVIFTIINDSLSTDMIHHQTIPFPIQAIRLLFSLLFLHRHQWLLSGEGKK